MISLGNFTLCFSGAISHLFLAGWLGDTFLASEVGHEQSFRIRELFHLPWCLRWHAATGWWWCSDSPSILRHIFFGFWWMIFLGGLEVPKKNVQDIRTSLLQTYLLPSKLGIFLSRWFFRNSKSKGFGMGGIPEFPGVFFWWCMDYWLG